MHAFNASLLKRSACALAAAGALALSGAASATTVANTVQYGYIHGYLEIFNTMINGVSGNTATVGAGDSITLSADWRIVTTDGNGNGYCPGCIIQEYVAWIPPAGAEGASPFNLGLLSFQDGYSPNGGYASGHFDWTTSAPGTAGTFFVGGGSTLDFQYQPTLQGGTGRYGNLTDLASFQITVPEPLSLALVGLGLVGIGISRRNKA